MKTRLTTAQALIRFLCAQYTKESGQQQRLIDGVFAIFGHGNVAGLGEALEDAGESMPVYRAHNDRAVAEDMQ